MRPSVEFNAIAQGALFEKDPKSEYRHYTMLWWHATWKSAKNRF